jgi:hypothetical protein
MAAAGLVLPRLPRMQSDPLDGTRWALEYLTLDGVSHMVSGRRIPEISFLDGRVSGDDGVNLGEGTYRLGGEKLLVEISPVTSISYSSETLPEHDLFEHLCSATRASMHGDFLHVCFGDSGDELVYRWEELEVPA